jgi:hypothetical protein
MAIRIGKWDCKQCGYVGNLGPSTRCEKCGAPRPENVKFYLTEDAQVVENTSQINEAKSGADWVCSFCGGHNKVHHANCQSCGNDREISDGDKSLQQKIHYFNQQKKQKSKGFKLGKGLKRFLIAFFSFVLLFIILAQFTSDVEVIVTGFKWDRTYELEEYKRVIEEGWELPNDAEKLDSYRAIHHYDQIPDGTETKTRTVQKQVGTEQVKVGQKDLGNGYFEDVYEERPVYQDVEETYQETKYRQEPVYKTKYKYAVFRWKDAGLLKASDSKKPAYWPQDERLNDRQKFRIKKQTENYYLNISYEDEKITEKVNFKTWDKTNTNDVLLGEKSTVFGTFYGLKNVKQIN